MLQYGGYTWLLDECDSPIQARIGPSCRTPGEVHWQVDFNYIATGGNWRRVKPCLRPTLRFCLYGFVPGLESWQDLEGQSFSSDDDSGCGGTLFIETTRLNTTAANLNVRAHRLQFVKRRDSWFTTELVAYPSVRQPAKIASLAAASVHPHGPSLEHASSSDTTAPEIHIVEDVPFGLVEVAAPANSRCPVTYARAKARALTGISTIATADAGPRLIPEGRKWRQVPGADWRVRLHHGGRWTHFVL